NLNTTENPSPPSPKVLAAIKAATDQRLRLYPNPTADPLREKLAKVHCCKPENLIVGNGCDELLALAVRAFVEPAVEPGVDAASRSNVRRRGGGVNAALPRATVQFFTPTYSLYPVLAEIHGAAKNPAPLK